MKIAHIYSHLNGLEFLKVHKPGLWTEIEQVILGIDAEACRTKATKEKRKKTKTADGLLYSPKAFNEAFKTALSAIAIPWKEDRYSYFVTADAQLIRQTLSLSRSEQKDAIEAAGQVAISTYNQTDFVKDRVAVEVQFGKYSFVAYDLFVKHMAFYVGDKIDVGIEILPMKSLQDIMSSGIAYYEGELSNLVRQGRGSPAVPLVLVGLEV
ncbi:MAG: BglII/BstYI family type II restriction endonuclease [Rhodanobacter sp.]